MSKKILGLQVLLPGNQAAIPAAMVLGKTIHLHNISKADFLQNKRLLNHELCHVRQYLEHGFVWFIL